MAQSTNIIVVSGRLGKDAEVKYTSDGKAVIKFSIAVNNRVKEGGSWRDETMWMDVVRFGGEGIIDYLKKGSEVVVDGRLECRNFTKDDGTKVRFYSIVASGITLCGGKREGGASNQDDEVPFP